jgi:hypothetical protein
MVYEEALARLEHELKQAQARRIQLAAQIHNLEEQRDVAILAAVKAYNDWTNKMNIRDTVRADLRQKRAIMDRALPLERGIELKIQQLRQSLQAAKSGSWH